MALWACADSAPGDSAQARLSALFPDLIGRPLTAQESAAVFKEFTALRAEDGCAEACLELLAANEALVARLRAARNKPLELLIRDRFVELTYFNDRQRGGVIQTLIAGANPIAVVDTKSRLLMTRSDVIALANLVRFAQTPGPPKDRPLAGEDYDRVIGALNAAVGPSPSRLNSHMPKLWAEASAVWLGIKRNGSRFTADERKAFSRHVLDPLHAPLPPALIGKIYETSPEETRELAAAYETAAGFAGVNEITRQALRVAEMSVGATTVINAINQAIGVSGN